MLFLVTGPPAAGKSTWVRQHAKPGDITIDYDAIAAVLTPLDSGERKYSAAVAAATKAARRAAIDVALEFRNETDVYVIHATPSEQMLRFYRRLGARVVVVDPGEATVLKRCREQRPWQMQKVAKRWYEGSGRPAQSLKVADSHAMPW